MILSVLDIFDVGGRGEVLVRAKGDTENGAVGAVHTQMEDAPRNPALIPRPHHKEARPQERSPLGVLQEMRGPPPLCGVW